MPKDNLKEMLPLCDEEGNIIGAATRGECHSGSRLMHPVVHLHVFNSKGELSTQKVNFTCRNDLNGKTFNLGNGILP